MYKNEKGFTLIEMMLVLLIIAVLILITVPNVFKYSKKVDEQGCNAYQKMVSGSIQAYKLEYLKFPESIDDLIEKEFLPKDSSTCPDGTKLEIVNGELVIADEKKGEDGN